MAIRKSKLVTGDVHHVFSKSIMGFIIFNNMSDFQRIKDLCKYYSIEKPSIKFSSYLKIVDKDNFSKKYFADNRSLVKIIAYCIMPTHIHLVLRQEHDRGISVFMNNILNGYTRYFNERINRKGPLWESRFKNVRVSTDEQLLHLTRYLHLNPSTAKLVESPEEWKHSSYREYLGKTEPEESICSYSDFIDISNSQYRRFVNSNKKYQQELAQIKHLMLG